MNPNREGAQSNFEVPAQPVSPEAENKGQEKSKEAPGAAAEQAGKQAPAPALPVIPDDIPAIDAPVIAIPVSDNPTHPVSDHPAQDSERIEPVWVNKAKQIIAQTREDPYQQKAQISRESAEYIQKRFNKQVKLDET
ncbi:hypothetical protein KW803_01170 [Candidatus Saccharibacteria bacterium]|nr:hypothetical protein [Candidatus Saccharibacteria bacterium]